MKRKRRRRLRPSVSSRELVRYRRRFLDALREDGVVCLECRLKRLRQRGVLPPLLSVIDRGRPVLELRRAGLWPIEIAARLGMQPQNVRKWLWKLRRRGVKIPQPRRLPPNFRRDLVGRR